MSVLKKTPFIETLLRSLTTEQLETLASCLNKPTKDISLKLCHDGPETLITTDMAGTIKTCSCRISKQKIINGIFIYSSDGKCCLIGYEDGVFGSDILPEFAIDVINRRYRTVEELLTADELRRVLDDAMEAEGGSGGGSDLEVYSLPESPTQDDLEAAFNSNAMFITQNDIIYTKNYSDEIYRGYAATDVDDGGWYGVYYLGLSDLGEEAEDRYECIVTEFPVSESSESPVYEITDLENQAQLAEALNYDFIKVGTKVYTRYNVAEPDYYWASFDGNTLFDLDIFHEDDTYEGVITENPIVDNVEGRYISETQMTVSQTDPSSTTTIVFDEQQHGTFDLVTESALTGDFKIQFPSSIHNIVRGYSDNLDNIAISGQNEVTFSLNNIQLIPFDDSVNSGHVIRIYIGMGFAIISDYDHI